MYDYNMLTPGPTKVRQNVLEARAIQAGNSDLDPDFYDFYKTTCAKYSHFLGTVNPSYLLSGEGMLGLEAACASLTEPGDRVLVLDNGIFGRGFADLVRVYGGEPVLLSTDPHAPISPEALRAFLKKDSRYRLLHLRRRHRHFLLHGHGPVAKAGQHIRYWILHTHVSDHLPYQLAFTTPGI